MKITDLIIDPRSLGNKLWLVDVVPAYEYKDNRRTDTLLGYRYSVAMPEKGLDKINVRIDGKQLMEAPDSYAEVRFDNLEVFIYWSQGQYQVGAKATGIHQVNTKTQCHKGKYYPYGIHVSCSKKEADMGNNLQSRKWALVINNPSEAGFDHSTIAEILQRFSPTYYCMADEIATTGTYHTHVFLYASSPIRFNTIKNRFPIAHIEKAYGSARDNRAYIRKEDKWADTDKAETSVDGTFEEWGDLPAEKEEKAPQMFRLVQNIRAGLSTTEIIDDSPSLAFRVRDIDLLRQTLTAEKYATENRNLEVTYLYGASGTGKTWGIYERHDSRTICRITNYRAAKGISFDGYNGQDVLVFEEFNGQIPIEDMLNYLDIYPLYLPARYNDRVACYTKVYITSNLPLERQYKAEQWDRPETWRAFIRRIHTVTEYLSDGSTITHKEGGCPFDQK